MITNLPQTITYWLPLGNNGTGGKTWSSGVAVKARIAEIVEEFFEDEGKKSWTNKAVYSKTKVPEGGYIIEGDYSGQASPVSGSQKVKKVSSNTTMTDLNRMLLQ